MISCILGLWYHFVSTCRCLEIFQFFSACLACLEVCKQLKFLFHVFWEDEGMEQLVSFLELIRRDSLLYYWKSAKSAPALCSPPSQPHQFFSFSAVGSHNTSYSPLEVASSKKKRQVQTAVLCIGNVVVLFCYIPAQKKCRCPLNLAWFLIPTS